MLTIWDTSKVAGLEVPCRLISSKQDQIKTNQQTNKKQLLLLWHLSAIGRSLSEAVAETPQSMDTYDGIVKQETRRPVSIVLSFQLRFLLHQGGFQTEGIITGRLPTVPTIAITLEALISGKAFSSPNPELFLRKC